MDVRIQHESRKLSRRLSRKLSWSVNRSVLPSVNIITGDGKYGKSLLSRVVSDGARQRRSSASERSIRCSSPRRISTSMLRVDLLTEETRGRSKSPLWRVKAQENDDESDTVHSLNTSFGSSGASTSKSRSPSPFRRSQRNRKVGVCYTPSGAITPPLEKEKVKRRFSIRKGKSPRVKKKYSLDASWRPFNFINVDQLYNEDPHGYWKVIRGHSIIT